MQTSTLRVYLPYVLCIYPWSSDPLLSGQGLILLPSLAVITGMLRLASTRRRLELGFPRLLLLEHGDTLQR